jgi:hypothetical protein
MVTIDWKWSETMKHKYLRTIIFLIVGTLVIATLSCSLITRTGELQTTSTAIPLERAESVAVDLRMGAGEMSIAGGSDMLMEADFRYNVPDWEPYIDYSISGNHGNLFIEQPDVQNQGLDHYRYEWDLRVNSDVLLDMDIKLGAGKSNLDLNQLAVTDLRVEIGAGKVEIDLTGDRKDDLVGSIQGGVGQLTILLPKDVGVLVTARGGMGSLDTGSLHQTEAGYVNQAFGETPTEITLDIEGGVGQIILKVVE